MVHLFLFFLHLIVSILFAATGGIMLYLLGLIFWDDFYLQASDKVFDYIWKDFDIF